MAKFNSHCAIKISLRQVGFTDLSFLLTEIRTKNYGTHPASISLVSTTERSTDTNALSKAKGSNVSTMMMTPNKGIVNLIPLKWEIREFRKCLNLTLTLGDPGSALF